jgi:hypothetical protein
MMRPDEYSTRTVHPVRTVCITVKYQVLYGTSTVQSMHNSVSILYTTLKLMRARAFSFFLHSFVFGVRGNSMKDDHGILYLLRVLRVRHKIYSTVCTYECIKKKIV